MKKAFFFIDDVVWVMRDLTRERPKSLFDNPFLKMLRDAHEKYSFKVQLNLFWRTDFFYLGEEFTLAEMTDAYKDEWEASSDWLKLAFHAKQEFPGYPYANADYSDVYTDCSTTRREIVRFAGEKSLANSLVVHWLPMSKDGCRALYDCGIRIMDASIGEKLPDEDNFELLGIDLARPRVIHKRKPETMIYRRNQHGKISYMLASHNHLTYEQVGDRRYTLDTIKDEETGLLFKDMCCGPCLDRFTMDEIVEITKGLTDYEFVGAATHEQYFYPDYFNHQPDHGDKIHTFAKAMFENGFEFFFIEELAK